ncbi:hypothetical protein [Flavobacterium columnare]|uniref:hypothetical protein n=1 Tax=Flavobacterium columnare TaxID=996 RepID=UPI002989C650|nr:hypothetical protein [Flavobacterium columnare]
MYRSFIDGRLVAQESKLGHNYNELQKNWRQKVKEYKERHSEQQKIIIPTKAIFSIKKIAFVKLPSSFE